jgi:predicted transcriptional regulator
MKRKVLQSSINFRCTSDILSRLNALAEAVNQHRSQLMREAVFSLLRRHDKRKRMAEITEPIG